MTTSFDDWRARSPFYNESHEAVAQSVRRFMAQEVLPHIDRWEAEGELPRELHKKAAAAGILEQLAASPKPPETQAFLEVPHDDDQISLASWPGLAVEWMPRDENAPGALMVLAAERAALPLTAPARGAPALADVDVDSVILWDQAAPQDGGFYGWVAGEAAAVLAIRRLLIQDRGIDRKALNLMGYWREGRVLD